MLPVLIAKLGQKIIRKGAQIGLKSVRYFIDSSFRDKVTPVPGSVLYCDLWLGAEHSGIYLDDGEISNIVVDGLAESTVRRSSPQSFTEKSTLGKKIYVSCDKNGAVGHPSVAHGAAAHVGERSFYGYVIKNCHSFSSKCVGYATCGSLLKSTLSYLPPLLRDPACGSSLSALKQAALLNLKASKWRLWDWQNEEAEPPPEPDWQAQADFFSRLPLNLENIGMIRDELAAMQDYEAEIADENIPDHIRQRLQALRALLADIDKKYDEVKEFIAACPGADFSYGELKASRDDFRELARLLQNNARIKELARKMGRNYISEERKKQIKIPQASKSEVHGTHRSDDLMRVLPGELLNLEDETMETLFYSRLLEKNLLSYELKGTSFSIGETTETRKKRTGPVVACLDTSGSMQGQALMKAKALLLAIAKILKQEDRSLHVLLFGSTGEIREFSMDAKNDAAGLLKFLQQGFGGGTDFETPLQRALEIIAEQKDYLKADVLMISDGDCTLSSAFTDNLKKEKARLDCSIYSVLCAGNRVADAFSDEVVVL